MTHEENMGGNWGQRSGWDTDERLGREGFAERMIDKRAGLAGLTGEGGAPMPGGGMAPAIDSTLEGFLGDEASSRGVEADEFARSSNRLSDIQQGQQRNLRSNMAQHGFGGPSGLESQLSQAISGQGAGELSDLVRNQNKQRFDRSNQVSDRNLNANLQLRGQDVTQRGQDQAARNAMLGMVFGNSGGGLY